MSCYPSYPYSPTFTPSNVGCTAPTYHSHRARLFAGGAFFRTKLQGEVWNLTSLKVESNISGTSFTLTVQHPNFPTEIYTVSQVGGILPEDPPCTTSGIDQLRAAVNANTNSIIEMVTRPFDIFDVIGMDEPCLSPFATAFMEGGSGAPTDSAGLASIRTGPTRSIIILATLEDYDGSPITPPANMRIQQWNGNSWISYCNLVPGECPGEGTC